MNHLPRARQVFDIEMEALKSVRDRLGPEFNRAVRLIIDTVPEHGKIVVVGIGKSGHIGNKISATLTSTGTPAVLLHSVDALHGDLGIIATGDLILALSYSGETDELVQLLPAIKRFEVRLIAFTGQSDSTLARYSDLVLDVGVSKEACPFNLAPTASTTAMLALGDALAMAVLRGRGFKESDFAKYHPSGSIGRALLVRLCDIMRTGKRNPVVAHSTPVKEALWVMTRARSGSVSVVDRKGRLVGVFTDGDLRRQMAESADVLARPIKEVMTPNPFSLREDVLAAEALKIFNAQNIDDLIVVNAAHKPVGIVDLQDLPKLKLL